MAKESVLAGTTSHSVNIFIQDSSSTVGAGLSGLVFNTSGLTASYTFTGANATRAAITLATLAAVNSAFSSGGFKEIDATNMKGGYRLDVPNASLAAASGQTVTFELHGATNMAPCWFEIELTATNNQDGVRGGMTALPNAAAGASGGGIINGSNSGTVTLAALTVTGSLTVSDGLLISRSSSNTSAITATGNGTGSGAVFTSGSGATGDGVQATAASTNGTGLKATGIGTESGIKGVGGATGRGCYLLGGATSGAGLRLEAAGGNSIGLHAAGFGSGAGFEIDGGATGPGILAVGGGTSGDGVKVTTTNGHGLNLAPVGTNVHGALITGGNGGTSDGLKLVNGTGGVGLRASDLTVTNNALVGGTLGITGTATFAAINTGTITTTGNRSISGTTTLAGAVTANNASNNITGVTTTATVQTGTAQAGSANTITLAAGASATNGLYDPGMVRILSGTGAGQARVILDYNGTSKVAVIDRDWRTNPDNTSVYEVIATSNLISSNEGLAQAGAGSTITLNATASAVNNSYIGETVTIRAGTGQDQSRNIINYVGATKVATVDAAWSTNPDSTSVYVIWPLGRTTTVALGSALDFNATMKTSLNAATPAVTVSDKTGFSLSATGSAALTESYAADGATFTLNQAVYMIWSLLAERSRSTTTLTSGKLDGTAAMTFTLDSATAPTSQTRAT